MSVEKSPERCQMIVLKAFASNKKGNRVDNFELKCEGLSEIIRHLPFYSARAFRPKLNL
jgi:hypothetical protein